MDVWTDGWMDGWIDGWIDGRMDGCIDEWMNGRMDGWMDEWMDGWVDEWKDIDIFVNCNWVDTRWQQYSTHLHTNNTQNNTIHAGRVRAVPRLRELYPGICLTTEEKARKNLSQGGKNLSQGSEKPRSG